MDKTGLVAGDVLAKEIFPAIKRCRAIMPILTAGYAESLWCLRELYYATLQPNKIIVPMLLEEEDNIKHKNAGNWLLRIATAQKYFKTGEVPAMIKALKEKVFLLAYSIKLIRCMISQASLVAGSFCVRFWFVTTGIN